METKEITIWERFVSKTPPFWRKIQFIGAILGGISATLIKSGVDFNVGDNKLSGLLGAISGSIVLIAQFAVPANKLLK